LASSTGTLYTAPTINPNLPTNATDIAMAEVKSIILCNTDSSDRTFTLYVVESGGTADATRMLFNGVTIKAGETLEYWYGEDVFPLASAETIRGKASVADKVTIRIGVRVLSYAQS
jgi:hypothetical protein